MKKAASAIYWDASAILSALFRDEHSDEALKAASNEGAVHVLSSLAWSETQAVIARIEREPRFAAKRLAAVREALGGGPWRYLSAHPDVSALSELARKWPLRGADLWHLATAKVLQLEFPNVMVLSFDARLSEAARGEGL